MIGVITRRAIVRGSMPADDERNAYDTVAYCGKVPIRMLRQQFSEYKFGDMKLHRQD